MFAAALFKPELLRERHPRPQHCVAATRLARGHGRVRTGDQRLPCLVMSGDVANYTTTSLIINLYAIEEPFQAESKLFFASCRTRYFDVNLKGWQHHDNSTAEFKRHCSDLPVVILLRVLKPSRRARRRWHWQLCFLKR